MSSPGIIRAHSYAGQVELPHQLALRPRISHVVFDFDGTLSWLRHGWPEIMLEVMRERLPPLPADSEGAVRALLSGIIHGLNGRPTILQMIRFADVVRERGGPALVPEQLRRIYQDRLDERIAERIASIRDGSAPRDAFVVFAVRPLLEKIVREGLTLVVLSSTVEERVREEAEVLGLSGYFGGRIHGCVGDPEAFSKRAVFERLLREGGLGGEQLLSFGDGPVEILDTKRLGGTAIAVCSDEDDNGSGVINPVKREALLAAGADVVIPDYRDAAAVVDQLRGLA
jgi:phosphoglycolate phosphatase-like HAD superfamily hydrolase